MDDARRLIAAFFESTEAGVKLATAEPELLKAKTRLGETALHYLAVENQIQAVKALVAMGADINNLSACAGTPLSESASLGYADLVKYLLEAGARIHVEGQNEPALHGAAAKGSVETVEALLNAGADVNAVDDLKATALHLAAERDHPEIIRILLRAGADPQRRRIFDETPLDVARNRGSENAEIELQGFPKS